MLGMTEAGSVCLCSATRATSPSTGAARSGARARVRGAHRRPRDARRTSRSASSGELWLRGPFLMEGYYGRERHETFTADGWFRTGDLFHVDAEGFSTSSGGAAT